MSRTIICNKCGKVMDACDMQMEFHVRKILGYGSEHDGDEIELDLCCACVDELVNSCSISPIIYSNEPIIYTNENIDE